MVKSSLWEVFWFVKLMSVHLVMATSPLEMQSLDHDPRLCLSVVLLCCVGGGCSL